MMLLCTGMIEVHAWHCGMTLVAAGAMIDAYQYTLIRKLSM